MSYHVSADGRELFERIERYLSPQDVARVRTAHSFARQAHGDQRRKSGELYFTHPVTVAFELSKYRLDADALIAALMHDVAEDTIVGLAEIRDQFGGDVATIVEGVTKFQQTTDDASQNGRLSKQQVSTKTLAKLFKFMTQDVRVVLIKLFDRLHNMQTLGAMPAEKQKRIANETLYVYAPLANRLGMWTIKNALQSLCLLYIDRDAFVSINKDLDLLYSKQKHKLNTLRRHLRKQLEAANVPFVDILPSPRNAYTIYEQGGATGYRRAIDQTLRFVIIVPDRATCYQALGAIHALWTPVPKSFDDYIARPRENLYRALHTTLVNQRGETVKIRFRSEAMNIVSELGVLARWASQNQAFWSTEMSREVNEQVTALFDSINQNIELEPQDQATNIRGVVEDVLGEQITVYTPRGEARELPKGATPIDFGFTIHTEVASGAHSAYINDQLMPLNTPLKDGDRVQLLQRGKTPQRVWLDEDLGYLYTTRAQSFLRRWFRRLPTGVAMRDGRQILVEEMDTLGLAHYAHGEIADWLGYANEQELYQALGYAELLPTDMATRVLQHTWVASETRDVGQVTESKRGEQFVILSAGERKVRMCHNCDAHIGDSIVGFIRKDGGVTVHREGCHLVPRDPLGQRLLRLQWGEEGTKKVHLATVEVDVYDRPNLLYEITTLLQEEHVNIAGIHTMRIERDIRITIDLEVTSSRQLVRILHQVKALVNVYAVRCQMQPDPRGGNSGTFYFPE